MFTKPVLVTGLILSFLIGTTALARGMGGGDMGRGMGGDVGLSMQPRRSTDEPKQQRDINRVTEGSRQVQKGSVRQGMPPQQNRNRETNREMNQGPGGGQEMNREQNREGARDADAARNRDRYRENNMPGGNPSGSQATNRERRTEQRQTEQKSQRHWWWPFGK